MVGVIETFYYWTRTCKRNLHSKLHNYRWQEILLTPDGDNSLNLVLSLSKDVQAMEPCEINLMGGLLSLWTEAQFLIIVPYIFKVKSPLGTQKFHLSQRRLSQCRAEVEFNLLA